MPRIFATLFAVLAASPALAQTGPPAGYGPFSMEQLPHIALDPAYETQFVMDYTTTVDVDFWKTSGTPVPLVASDAKWSAFCDVGDTICFYDAPVDDSVGVFGVSYRMSIKSTCTGQKPTATGWRWLNNCEIVQVYDGNPNLCAFLDRCVPLEARAGTITGWFHWTCPGGTCPDEPDDFWGSPSFWYDPDPFAGTYFDLANPGPNFGSGVLRETP